MDSRIQEVAMAKIKAKKGKQKEAFTRIQAAAKAKNTNRNSGRGNNREKFTHIQAAAIAKKDEIMSRIKGLTSAEEVKMGQREREAAKGADLIMRESDRQRGRGREGGRAFACVYVCSPAAKGANLIMRKREREREKGGDRERARARGSVYVVGPTARESE
jgi:hypothetical protein